MQPWRSSVQRYESAAPLDLKLEALLATEDHVIVDTIRKVSF